MDGITKHYIVTEQSQDIFFSLEKQSTFKRVPIILSRIFICHKMLEKLTDKKGIVRLPGPLQLTSLYSKLKNTQN